MSILVFANPYLDLAPRRDVVDGTLAELWRGPAPSSAKSVWLRRFGDDVIAHGDRTLTLVGELAKTWPTLPMTIYFVGPSALGPMLISDLDGVVYTWVPGEKPEAIWRTNEPGGVSAWSLGPDRILVQRYHRGDDAAKWLRAISVSTGEVLWTAPGTKFVEAVVPGGVLLSQLGEESPDILEYRATDTGEIRWATTFPFGHPLALVDDVLWKPDAFKLLRLDMRTGELVEPVAIPQSALPGGVVDERGIFHCSHGSNYQTYDLRDGGRELSAFRFKITFARGPKPGAGSGRMVVTPDGRMIFGDQGGSVWVWRADRPTEPELVWNGKRVIFGLLAHRGRLVVDLDGGMMAILGKPYLDNPQQQR